VSLPSTQPQVENQNLMSITSKRGDFKPLFDNLSHVIAVSRNKFDLVRASNLDKQRWARLLITGCEAYAKLLEASKIDELEARLTRLEEEKHHE
jgi:hypothetical protein